ncbi:uncharacterized protein [Antedon mediterranea]|uniref:uncharacterized protein n=1 Tax=Antedon mediterranea TaxID=105859 RepID=UPI003AF57DE4
MEEDQVVVPQLFDSPNHTIPHLKNDIIIWLKKRGLGWRCFSEDVDSDGLFFVNTLAEVLLGVWYIRSRRETNINIEIPDLFSELDAKSDKYLKASALQTEKDQARHQVFQVDTTEMCMYAEMHDRQQDARHVETFGKLINDLTSMMEKPYFNLDCWEKQQVKQSILRFRGYLEEYAANQKRMNPRDYNN